MDKNLSFKFKALLGAVQCDQNARLFVLHLHSHLAQWKFEQKYKKFNKVGFKMSQILNKHSINGQTLEMLPK